MTTKSSTSRRDQEPTGVVKNRRRMERFPLELPALIILITPDQRKEFLDLRTRDICAGGAYFLTTHPLPCGTEVLVELSLPTERLIELTGTYAHLRVRGTVKRCEPNGMAVYFHDDYQMIPIRNAG